MNMVIKKGTAMVMMMMITTMVMTKEEVGGGGVGGVVDLDPQGLGHLVVFPVGFLVGVGEVDQGWEEEDMGLEDLVDVVG